MHLARRLRRTRLKPGVYVESTAPWDDTLGVSSPVPGQLELKLTRYTIPFLLSCTSDSAFVRVGAVIASRRSS